MNYSITDDGAYKCAECEKVSLTLLAHNSHYRRHKNAAAKAVQETPVSTRTVRTVVTAQPVNPVALEPVQPAPTVMSPTKEPQRRGWLDRLFYGEE